MAAAARPASPPRPASPLHTAIPRPQASWSAWVCAATFGALVVPRCARTRQGRLPPAGPRRPGGCPAARRSPRPGRPPPPRPGPPAAAPPVRAGGHRRRCPAAAPGPRPSRLAGHLEQPRPQPRVQLRPGRDQDRDPVRRISSAIRSPDSAGSTGAAIPAACAASVAAYSIEVSTLLSVHRVAAPHQRGQRVGDPRHRARQLGISPVQAAGVIGRVRYPLGGDAVRPGAGGIQQQPEVDSGSGRMSFVVMGSFPIMVLRWVPRSSWPSGEAIVAVMTSPSRRYRVRPSRPNSFHRVAGGAAGEQRGDLGRCLQRGAAGRAGQQQVARAAAAGTWTAGSARGPAGRSCPPPRLLSCRTSPLTRSVSRSESTRARSEASTRSAEGPTGVKVGRTWTDRTGS